MVDLRYGHVHCNYIYINRGRLEGDLYGRIVLYNCGVKQHVDKMKKVEEQQEKKRKLFEGILNTETTETSTMTTMAPPVKKKKGNFYGFKCLTQYMSPLINPFIQGV